MKKILLIALLSFVSASLFAQETITGSVKDDQGQPLPGATILVKGTNTYAIADATGNFSISPTIRSCQ